MNSVVSKVKLPSWPHIAADEIAAVAAVLSSGKINYWTGENGRLFESEFAAYIGCKYAVAIANGTVGLELALKSLNILPGDEVIVPSKTFIATASAVVACQAIPIVVDVELASQNISLQSISSNISAKTKGIIVVHLAGLACDMDPILAFAKQHGLWVIEDCAQAHGAKYKDKFVGSFGDVSVFSFCQDKIITTGGEGGMLLTNNQEIWQHAWEYKDHGKDYVSVHDTKLMSSNANFKWLHHSFGTNFRLTEMQAVIGRLQLLKLPAWLQLRQRNAKYLLSGIKTIPGLTVFEPSKDFKHAYYKFYFHLNLQQLNTEWSKTRILLELSAMGIPCSEGSCSEIYREQAFINSGFGPKTRLEVAALLSATSLMLPVHPSLELEHMQIMLDGLKQVMESATA